MKIAGVIEYYKTGAGDAHTVLEKDIPELYEKYGLNEAAYLNAVWGVTNGPNAFDVHTGLQAEMEAGVNALAGRGYDYERMTAYETREEKQAAADARMQAQQEFAEQHPILASVGTVISKPFQGIDVAGSAVHGIGHSNADDLESYVPIPGYAMPVTNYVNTTRGTVLDGIDSKAGKLFYQAGMGVADTAVTAVTTALTGTTIPAAVIDFSQAAADGAWDIQQRGGSNSQILLGGLAYGVLDAALGQIPMNKLLKTDGASGIKQFAKQVLQQSAVEATEEMVGAVAGIITDAVVMRENSRTENRVQEYMAQGMSEEKARNRALLDNVKTVALAGAEGFIAGAAYSGIIGGVRYTAGKLREMGSTIRQRGQTADILQSALDMPADTKAHQQAVDLTDRLETKLTELGMDTADLYHMTRADQQKLIDQVMDEVLTDEAIGNLAAAVEMENYVGTGANGETAEDLLLDTHTENGIIK